MRWLMIFFFGSGCVLPATEYFVTTGGDDSSGGRSREEAFATIGKGVSVLKPGDILTICPGEYFESVTASVSGTKDAPVVIRAERPGTVVVRGDKRLKADFARAPKLKYGYVCPFTGKLNGIIERDSVSFYLKASSVKAVDERPGQYFHDEEAGKLYVHTSGSMTPEKHVLTLSGVAGENGLFIKNRVKGVSRYHFMKAEEEDWVSNVVIEGLAFTGFAQPGRKGRMTGTGLRIYWPRNCVIRDCVSFLNGHGIICRGTPKSRDRETDLKRDRADNCVIERCVAYGNVGYGIVIAGSVENSAIRDCITFKSSGHSIRFYAGVYENCTLKHNIALGRRGIIWIKGLSYRGNSIIGNVCYGIENSGKDNIVAQNLATKAGGSGYEAVKPENNILLKEMEDLNLSEHFVDPLHLDYRLQSDSSFRGTGRAPHSYKDEVFFVGPDGNDNALGTSVGTAWRTLAHACRKANAGQTVYILPGTYEETLVPANSGEKEKALVFRRRGLGEVVVKGIDLADKEHVRVEGFAVIGRQDHGIRVENGNNVEIGQCVIAGCKGSGVYAVDVEGLRISHCTLTSSKCNLELKKCRNAVVTANIFSDGKDTEFSADEDTIASLWSDRNTYSSGLAKRRETTGLEAHSIEVVPEFTDSANGDFYLKNAYAFRGRGPLAMPIGPYERIERSVPLTYKDLRVRSITATTANIDFETPGVPVNPYLCWGPTPECERRVEFLVKWWVDESYKSLSHSFSIAGLKPGTKYCLKAASRIPVETCFANEKASLEEGGENRVISSEVISFATMPEDRPSRTCHVATTGDDRNSGLSEKDAFGTISHAARKAKPGDTVIVHDGTFRENVVIAATGDKSRPITFKAENPGKVFLRGDGLLKNAFQLSYRNHIIIDGFYITDFARRTPGTLAWVYVMGGSNNTIRRCILDGRKTYPKQLLGGRSTKRLTVENCVFRNAWTAIDFSNSSDVMMRNNVFYGNMVGCIKAYNSSEEHFTISHSIICDQVPKKRTNPFTQFMYFDSITEEYNCYFIRLPPDEKMGIYIRGHGDWHTWVKWDEFWEKTGLPKTSFFDNPGMKILKEYEVYTGDMTGRPHKFVTQELNFRDGKPVVALYDEFFATNPRCVKAADGRPIGLDPDAFEADYGPQIGDGPGNLTGPP